MKRLALLLITLLACCGQMCGGPGTTPSPDPANDGGGSTDPSLLEGPGFSLTIPQGFTLATDQTTNAGQIFLREYVDDLGSCRLGVLVQTPTAGQTSDIESLRMRIKAAARTATNDFMLVGRLWATDFPFEMEAAVGQLADGNVLIVGVGASSITAAEEMLSYSLYTSVEMFNTDGTALQGRWQQQSPAMVAKADNDMFVLDDGTTWRLYSDEASDQLAESRAWQISDPVFHQLLIQTDVDNGELVHAGRWKPVAAYKAGTSTVSSVVNITGDVVTLSDGTAWVVGLDTASAWVLGDTVCRVTSNSGNNQWVIHARTGKSLFNPAQVIAGPGFHVTIPSGAIDKTAEFTTPTGMDYVKVLYDSASSLGYFVAVAPDSSNTSNGTYTVEGFSMRLKGSVLTRAGDLLLVVRMEQNTYGGLVMDAAIGKLADGRLLLVALLADKLDSAAALAANNLFQSVDMTATDGKAIEASMSAGAAKLRLYIPGGFIVLDDLTVYELPYNASAADALEVQSWTYGDSIGAQSYREQYSYSDTYELVKVGNWKPVEVDYVGIASQTTITGLSTSYGSTKVSLSDNTSWTVYGSLSNWSIGNSVLRVQDSYSKYLIHEPTRTTVNIAY